MATIVNTPAETRESSGAGVIVGVIVAIVLLALLAIFGIPALRGTTGGSSVNLPDKVNVNVQGGGTSGQ